jgi:hypothetical protein
VILIPDYGNGLSGEDPRPFNGSYAIHEFGKVESQGERERYVSSLLEMSFELSLPPIVVAEEWDPPVDRRIRMAGGETGFLKDPRWTYQTILGIGEGWGRWTAEIETASAYLESESNLPWLPVVRVTPNDWRDGIFPRPRPRDRQALKETAARVFEGVFGYAVSEDVAEAGCIGLWAIQAPQVAAAAEVWKAAVAEKSRVKSRVKSRAKSRGGKKRA